MLRVERRWRHAGAIMKERIPITISHGTNRGRYFTPRPRWREIPPIDAAYFDALIAVAAELQFRSISYDDLAAWRAGAALPDRPIMFDFDHPNRCIHREVFPVMRLHGHDLHQHDCDGEDR
jgi:hypothetical protein